MDDDDDALLLPGRFGELTLLSAKALRVYAERGLLVPAYVDPATGYRHYAAAQVGTGWLIGLLRSAGLPLDDVGAIVGAEPAEALARLDAVVAGRHEHHAAVLAVLARARRHLSEEHPMPTTTVTSAVEPDRAVLSTSHRLAPDDLPTAVPAEVARLRRVAAACGLQVTGAPFGVFHAPVTDDSDGPLEVVLPVDALADGLADDGVRSYRLTGGLVAARDAAGAEATYPALLAVYDEVRSWIHDAGHTPVGPPREVWHDAPDLLTVAWPYAPAPA